MFELNAKIRKFQETFTCNFHKEFSLGTLAGKELKGVPLSTLEDMLDQVISQTSMMEEEYLAEQNIQKQTQKELIDCERNVSLTEVILKTTQALQDLTRQTSELEQMCTALGEELQRRCICPNCHLDNVEVLGGIL
ncbi:uncharacterized protein LOC112090721 [Morus notabilis]|uniref:uncharacterized protein LOC112090721 n=1 Tax=Morus notabilis TaxID=981085 RepID=UPI000CED0C26|nr:uncharacterized protein LOC112090721 [Morus notabilis]